MINKSFIAIFTILLTGIVYGQKNVNSPYSYYGLGETRFGGNTENALMGGINSYVDSTRVDVRNPASLGKLFLTTYSLGFTTDFRTLSTDDSSSKTRTSTIDYMALSFPVYKNLGVSIGLSPYSSTGYKLTSLSSEKDNNITQIFEGNGGINRLYLATGYTIVKGFRVGVATYFNFGKTTIRNLRMESNSYYATREESNSTYRGISFSLGAQYDYKITDKLTMSTTLSYVPKVNLTSTNSRTLETLQPTLTATIVKDLLSIDLGDIEKTKLTIPSELSFGVGIGQDNKWFVGTDYTIIHNNEFNNPFITSTFVNYKQGYNFGIGGFFIPQYNSFSGYWKRVTYRAGFYYKNTGLELHNEQINDFGITFGVSLPVRGFSNATIGAQYGSRGTKSNNLIKENYFGLKLALTLNDKWFQKSKYN